MIYYKHVTIIIYDHNSSGLYYKCKLRFWQYSLRCAGIIVIMIVRYAVN